MDSAVASALSSLRAVGSRLSVDSRKFTHPYYIVNTLLAISFIFLRLVRPFCSMIWKSHPSESAPCELDLREHEVLIFVGCVTVIKNRGAPTWQHYLKKFALYCKVANVYLFWRLHPAFGIGYLLICAVRRSLFWKPLSLPKVVGSQTCVLWATTWPGVGGTERTENTVQLVFVPEPIYSGPQKIEYFSGLQNMERTISEDTRTTWLICFYTTWSMKCIDIAPVFAELSGQYWLPNFRFGKIDVGRYAEVAQKYQIGTGAWTRQLPTIMLFKDGTPQTRRPFIDTKGQIPKYEFAVPTLIQDFDMNNEYEACKSRLGKKTLQELSKNQPDKKKD